MHLVTLLRILEHVSYTIETIGNGATGETRESLSILIDTFQFEDDIPSKLRKQWLAAGRRAMKCLVERGDSQAAAKCLSGISRRLWLLVDDHVPIAIRLNDGETRSNARKRDSEGTEGSE